MRIGSDASVRSSVHVTQELERLQDAQQRLQGIHVESSSDASSRSPVAESGEPSAAPNFDPRSRLATCASVGDVSSDRAKAFDSVKLFA
jgi:hypothetical protein